MTAIDRTASIVRGTTGQAWKIGRRVANRALGTVSAIRHRGPKPDMDDVTLARKVETVIFREADAPKGQVDVNVVEGVVELRGVVRNPGEKAALEGRARKVPEVQGVRNHLHLVNTPAPGRADSPGRSKRKSTAGPVRKTNAS